MHELSLAHSIFELVQEHVPRERGPEVRTVRVRVGDMAGVIADSLAFCFDAIVAGTPYASARLLIEPVPPTYRCTGCANEFSSSSPVFGCPDCGHDRVRLVHGRELQVADLELGEPKDVTP